MSSFVKWSKHRKHHILLQFELMMWSVFALIKILMNHVGISFASKILISFSFLTKPILENTTYIIHPLNLPFVSDKISMQSSIPVNILFYWCTMKLVRIFSFFPWQNAFNTSHNELFNHCWLILFLLETYAPQVIIKTRITKPILAQNYSLLCNARGNPIPRLRWSKNNEKSEYYPSTQQCKIASRIFSVQHKYINPTFLRLSFTTNSFSGINLSSIFNPWSPWIVVSTFAVRIA